MQIIGCQTDIYWLDKQANFAAVRAMLTGAAIARESLIVLPEMFATGFGMDADAIAETADGPTNQFLADLAREYSSYVVGGVVALAPDGRGRNQAAVFGPNGLELARYDKLYPFSFGGENRHYSGGQDVVVAQCGPWRSGAVGLLRSPFSRNFSPRHPARRHAAGRDRQLAVGSRGALDRAADRRRDRKPGLRRGGQSRGPRSQAGLSRPEHASSIHKETSSPSSTTSRGY